MPSYYYRKFQKIHAWAEMKDTLLQKCSFDEPLPRLFKPFGFVKKHGRQGAGLIFPIYLLKTLKIFLSETTGLISI